MIERLHARLTAASRTRINVYTAIAVSPCAILWLGVIVSLAVHA